MSKILLVEDNLENQEMLARRLTRRGYEVLFAKDGVEAVEVNRSERPDLILMDMNMPVLDGWEATRQIRTEFDANLLPIIAVTAHSMSGDRDKILQAGCNDHHPKPVDLTRLLAQIEGLLSRN